jgi:guanine deaminase
MDLPLLQWLEKYTFPCESKFADTDFARYAYEKSIQRHLKCGTTFASYFATIHLDACKVMVDILHKVGQRAFVGKVSMDRNSPDFYREETKEGCEKAEEFVKFVLSQTPVGKDFLEQVLSKVPSSSSVPTSTTTTESPSNKSVEDSALKNTESSSHETSSTEELLNCSHDSEIEFLGLTLLNTLNAPTVLPCITPRFVPTCTGHIMHALGKIAAKYGLPIQSHMSESVNEIEWVNELHPECPTYADCYERHGLLNERAYMAHCCHSTEEEMEVLKRSGASVVHCASSNFMLSSGVMDVRLFVEKGIKVAIGTDVAGGYSPSMLDAIRQTVVASRVKGFEHKFFTPNCYKDDVKKDYNSLSYLEVFHLATVGGAEVLGFGDVLGNFIVGKKLDCLVVDVHVPNSPIDTFEHESYFDHFEKFLFLGDDRNIVNVFVNGRQVI